MVSPGSTDGGASVGRLAVRMPVGLQPVGVRTGGRVQAEDHVELDLG